MRKQTVVAIPVRDEEDRIGKCLAALARQSVHADHIVLLLNNCVDDTVAVVRAAPEAARRVHVAECSLPGSFAGAGVARSLAMDHALSLLDDGVLLTTDADAEVADDWIEANLSAIEDGADAVCGIAAIDPLESLLIPQHLHEDDAREVAYARLLDEIGSIITPDPADPWPRHSEDSGASIAITAPIFRRVGGMPDIPSGEDRALIEKLRMIDARIRHDPNIVVTVSGRIEGRAQGGMADTIRRRIAQQDKFVDDRIEPALHALRRLRIKRRFSIFRSEANEPALRNLARFLSIAPNLLMHAADAPHFGMGWAMVERASSLLARRRVAFADLPHETAIARAIHRCMVKEAPVDLPPASELGMPQDLLRGTA